MPTNRVFKVFIATSIDGFISRQDGDISWLTNPPENKAHIPPSSPLTIEDAIADNLSSVKYIVMGRGTYEKIVEMGEWPYSNHQVFVLSTTLQENSDVKVKVVRSVDEALNKLQTSEPGNVYVDGGKVIRGFLDRSLIDEITITTAPVVLGRGLPLFTELSKEFRLALVEQRVFKGGMVLSRYQVIKEDEAARIGRNIV